MRWKTTAVLLAAAAGIGAYISLYELKQPDPAERLRRQKHVVNIGPDDVSRITVDFPRAKTTLTRSGEAWTMTPGDVRADTALIETLLSSVSPLSATRTLSGKMDEPLDPKAYGLDPAVGWVSLVEKDSAVTLLFGEGTAVGEYRYLKLAQQPEIFVVPAHVFSAIDKPLEDFRDPFLIRTNQWLAQRLAVASETASYTLLRKDNDWQLNLPKADAADRAAVAAVFNALERMNIARFVSDAPKPEELSSAGLDNPKTQVLILGGDPPAETTISFGGLLADDASLIYARRSDEPALYAVAAGSLQPLLKKPDELRQKALFGFFTGNVTKISRQWNDARWEIARTADGQWKQPDGGEALDGGRVEGFINRIADARLSSFVDEAPDLAALGLDKPQGVLSITVSDDTQEQRLEIGATLKDSQDRYCRLVSRDVVGVLPEVVAALLSTTTPASLNKTESPDHPLDDGQVDQNSQQQQRPPE